MLSRKQDVASVAEAGSEFEAAEARWDEINGTHTELVEREEAMRLALSLAVSKNTDRVPQHLRDKAAPHLKLAQRRRPKLIDALADLTEEIQDHNPVAHAAREEWERAQRAETNRIALGLQGRHRSAVKEIATALEALSRAIAAEQDCHDELRRQAPKPTSPNLPDLHSDFHDMAVSQWGSTAWHWAKCVRDLKII